MQKLIDTYLNYLSSHPDVVNSIILWTMTSILITIILLKTERERIDGSKGTNKIWESAEQIIHIMSWIFPYVMTFAIYFKVEGMYTLAWYLLIGGLAYAIGGRWIFEWALAFITRSKTVSQTTTQTSEEKVEVKEETK